MAVVVVVGGVIDFVKPHGKQVMLFSYTSLQNWPVFSQTAARSKVTSEHCDGRPILFRSGSEPSCRSVVVVSVAVVVVAVVLVNVVVVVAVSVVAVSVVVVLLVVVAVVVVVDVAVIVDVEVEVVADVRVYVVVVVFVAVVVDVTVVVVVVVEVAHLQLPEHSQALGVARIEEHTLPSISSNQ